MSAGDQHNLIFIDPDWPAPANIRALSTTRNGGFSEGVWGSFNLADHVGDAPLHVRQNRDLLVSALNLPAEPCWLRQVHGCSVLNAADHKSDTACDASFSFDSGQVCAVLTADCLPLLFCTRGGDRVAAVHAGWRGLAAGVIEQAVEKFSCERDQILVWLGPAIGPTAFEVGDDVYTVFTGAWDAGASAFVPQDDKWLCDIYQLARDRLQRLGIRNIYGGKFCTYHDAARFYSYRRDGTTGRMASLIWIEK